MSNPTPKSLKSTPVNTPVQKPTLLNTFFELAFRPFFLLSAFYAIWLLLRWTLTLTAVVPWNSELNLFSWHAHEFQFGFALSVVYGFLLTAAQTWTGVASIKHRKLMALVGLWLIARIAMNTDTYPLLVSLIADSGVIIISALVLLKMILQSKNYRNLIFIAILLVFLALHISQLYSMHNQNSALSSQISYATSWWFVFIISLVSTRILPFFISKAVNDDIKREAKTFTLITQLLIVILFIQTLVGTELYLNQLIGASLFCHLYRLYLWHHTKLWRNPMLWSLWLGYAFLPLALACMLTLDAYSNAMHLINVGFVGSMIMALTARVSLGHTGRKMQANALITAAFVLMIIAALSRGMAIIYLPQFYSHLMIIAATSWLLALCFFLFRYTPILIKPRVDSKN